MSERRILLCAAGLTPQIVTETLYALVMQHGFIPDEIHVITTREGAERVRLSLLDEDAGHFYTLCRDYADHGLDTRRICFDKDTIHIITGRDEALLDDIRSEADNAAAADAIMAVVRQLTADPGAIVHASIAGGRKTMGFFLGYAMSLFGRDQDRLSHVLVTPPFESLGEFYYKPRKGRHIELPRKMHTDDAEITLADIPFVRLRGHLDRSLLTEGASYSDTVRRAQRSLAPPELVLDAATRTAHCGGVAVKLSPVNFAFYAWFARRVKEGAGALAQHEWNPQHAREILDIYLELTRKDPDSNDDPTVRKLRTLAARTDTTQVEMQARIDYLYQRLSRLDSRLTDQLGSGPAWPYCVRDGRRGNVRYGLRLRPEQVRFGSVE